jgi:hypothetical protein
MASGVQGVEAEDGKFQQCEAVLIQGRNLLEVEGVSEGDAERRKKEESFCAYTAALTVIEPLILDVRIISLSKYTRQKKKGIFKRRFQPALF